MHYYFRECTSFQAIERPPKRFALRNPGLGHLVIQNFGIGDLALDRSPLQDVRGPSKSNTSGAGTTVCWTCTDLEHHTVESTPNEQGGYIVWP